MKKRPLLADLHVHTDYSDGFVPLAQVIDLYGQRGFDVIAITDHIAEEKTFIGRAAAVLDKVITRDTWADYKSHLDAEAARAWDQYKMIVIPGFELSKNSVSNDRSAHILGLGVSDYVPADGDPISLVGDIKKQGGVAIAAHPVHTQKMEKQTYNLWHSREELSDHFDAWEVASGPFIFEEVARTRLPKVASSDMHHPNQIRSWKTIVDSEPKVEAILDAIRKQRVDFWMYRGL